MGKDGPIERVLQTYSYKRLSPDGEQLNDEGLFLLDEGLFLLDEYLRCCSTIGAHGERKKAMGLSIRKASSRTKPPTP